MTSADLKKLSPLMQLLLFLHLLAFVWRDERSKARAA